MKKKYKKRWYFFLPLVSNSNDLIFMDGSRDDRLVVRPNEVVSDANLKVIVDYLKESRHLDSLDVVDKMLKYDDTDKYYYLEANYKFKGSDDVINGRIRMASTYGFMHSNNNFYVDYEEGKTELSDADIARLNKSFDVMKNNIFYGFDIGVLDTDHKFTLNELVGSEVYVPIGNNAEYMLFDNRLEKCGGSKVRELADSGIYRYRDKVLVPFRHDDSLNALDFYDDFEGKDLYVRDSVIFTKSVLGSIPLNDYVKSKNGGYDVTKVIQLKTTYYKHSSRFGDLKLMAFAYVDNNGDTKYYVIRIRDSMFSLIFNEAGGGNDKVAIASDELKDKVRDILEQKYGDIISDIQIDNVINDDKLSFTLKYMDGERVAGSVALASDPRGYLPLCPPLQNGQVGLKVYFKPERMDKLTWGRIYYDDEGYIPTKNKNPQPTTPSEIDKPVKPTTPSEIDKPVKPGNVNTFDKPKPSVPDNAKPIEKATPSVIIPSHDKPTQNGKAKPIPSESGKSKERNEVVITKIIENKDGTKVYESNGDVHGDFRNSPLQPDDKTVTIGTYVPRNVRTGDMSLAILFGSLALTSAFGLGFYLWINNKRRDK